MVEVGDSIEWIKPRATIRDWYGKVLELDEEEGKAKVEWIVRDGVVKVKWEPIRTLRKIDVIPIVERSSKLKLKELIEVTGLMNPDREWSDYAKCRGMDVNLFFYATKHPTAKKAKELKAICDGCPVMMECRAFALRTRSVGWFGGMDELDRLKWLQNLPRDKK